VGYRRIVRIAWDVLFLLPAPLAYALCYTAAVAPGTAEQTPTEHPDAPARWLTPHIRHEYHPESFFSLTLVADTVFEQAKARSREPLPVPANPEPTTLQEEDPFLLTLVTLTDAL
jgi:hypothetical protein